MELLSTYLKQRAERSLGYLLAQIEGISASDALGGITPGWPDHRWGIGQNGSIAGIVYHVAAWKQMTLPLFQPEGRPLSREEFDAGSAPDCSDWAGTQEWLKSVGAAWNAELGGLDDGAFDRGLLWEGMRLTVSKFVTEMLEHDIQHAAQIEYLRQLHRMNR